MKKRVAYFKLLKYTASALLVALLLILTLASPAMAWTPPGVDPSENATQVVLWGDNITLTLETDDLTLAGEVEVTGLADFLDDLFLFLIVVAVGILAVARRESIYVKIIASPLFVIYGARLAAPETPYSTMWIAGVVIVLIGLSFIFEPVIDTLIKKFKRKKESE